MSLQVAPMATLNWRTDVQYFEGIVKLENVPGGLRPGMTAEVEIAMPRLDNVLAVPSEAFGSKTATTFVSSCTKTVWSGARSSWDRSPPTLSEVTAGLEEGEQDRRQSAGNDDLEREARRVRTDLTSAANRRRSRCCLRRCGRRVALIESNADGLERTKCGAEPDFGVNRAAAPGRSKIVVTSSQADVWQPATKTPWVPNAPCPIPLAPPQHRIPRSPMPLWWRAALLCGGVLLVQKGRLTWPPYQLLSSLSTLAGCLALVGPLILIRSGEIEGSLGELLWLTGGLLVWFFDIEAVVQGQWKTMPWATPLHDRTLGLAILAVLLAGWKCGLAGRNWSWTNVTGWLLSAFWVGMAFCSWFLAPAWRAGLAAR